MTHMARKRSETGFYHVVIKGDGGQVLFEGDDNRETFIATMVDVLEEHKVEIHAYCLMDNHVHLLVKDQQANLSVFMKALNEGYAVYYRKVTGRVGHVFQGRFWSEPVNSDEQFLATLRYIHANPEQAGICCAKDFPWSSYRAFVEKPTFVRTDLALSLLGGKKRFGDFHADCGCYAKPFPKSGLSRHLTYDELTRIAVNLLGRETLNSLRGVKPAQRLQHIRALATAGFTETQIARITGIGQASIHRALAS